jgi:Gamma-glutamyl cyclotransferase, AIG2-like
MQPCLYGTLVDAGTLATCGGQAGLPARLVPAALHGWRRVAVRSGRYPTLRRARTGVVQGSVLIGPAHALRNLAAYEGPVYRLTRIVADTPNGKTAARAWIEPCGTCVPWNVRGR